MGRDREVLPDKEAELYLCLLISLFPGHAFIATIRDIFLSEYPEHSSLTVDQIKQVKRRNQEYINRLKKDQKLTLETAVEAGILPSANIVTRLLIRERLLKDAIEGYDIEVINKEGDVNNLKVKERRTDIIKILKDYREEMESLEVKGEGLKIEINYGGATGEV